jgi:predicted amidohydrolase YtcJ
MVVNRGKEVALEEEEPWVTMEAGVEGATQEGEQGGEQEAGGASSAMTAWTRRSWWEAWKMDQSPLYE